MYHSVDNSHEISNVVEVTRPMGTLPKIIVLCSFYVRGLARGQSFVSEQCITMQCIRQVVGNEKHDVCIHLTLYQFADEW